MDPAPGRTANELARDAAAHLPQLGTELSGAANAFNDVTYGESPGTPAAYQLIADLDDHLRFHSVAGQSGATEQHAVVWAPIR